MRGSSVLFGLLLTLATAASPAGAWQDWPGEWSPSRPSLTATAIQLSAAVERLSFIEAASFRLAVPFRTQKDGGRWQTSNCGPATLGMVLDGFGVLGQATDDLRFRSHTYQGTVGWRTGTALQHIAQVAEDFGVPTTGLYNPAGGFNAWSLDDIRGQLQLGRPVMPLVRLYLLPGYEDKGTRWGHYILLTGVDGDGFFYSDSLQTEPLSGTGGRVPGEQLARAMYSSLVPGQAVAFGGPGVPPLRVIAP